MKRAFRRILVLGLLLALAFWIRGALEPAPIEVTVTAVGRGAVEAIVTNTKAGTVRARRRAGLSPATSGLVVELPARRGARVPAGAPLVRIDDATQSAQLHQAEKALEVVKARQRQTCLLADHAHRELRRNEALAAEGIVSEDVVDQLRTSYEEAVAACEVAGAEVGQAEAAVGVARAEFEKTVLRAPFDAIVAEVSVELGEWITPSVPLFAAPDVIDALDPTSLYVSAPMDEVDAARLKTGLPVRVSIDPYPDRTFPGRVDLVAPYVLDVETQNRTLEIEVVLDDAEFSATLLPGTSADVEVILDVHEDVPRIPTQTLLEGDRVLVARDGVLAERELETGLRNWQWVEVLSGLEVGEEVVSSLDREGVVAGARVVVRRGEP